ncbi:PdxA family dehydrogenase [Anaerotalea alkaliphila]|uniref:4-hydroxythreonine-4-phosphate dehydrogenase PdxA n=1 Tax=Anaerotalea alkaliphila TaxID=2662126 RepID=A0A7X5KPQ9_9FIRM|nr:4-hydroxythreonine-4-phosphate dehydrogenase PdxA [Anaerotalea alkaliphila]NDL68747.1 4-hydroxythreonine-4-phosphate dehydrogenase PdxA [Anaerotalea alkaliphila]
MNNKPILGILLGDACGVGPEIIAKLAENNRLYPYCRPVIIGDARILEQAMKITGSSFRVQPIDAVEEARWERGNYPVLDQKNVDPKDIEIGKVSRIAGKAAGDMLITAMDLCLVGELDGFAFAPLNKTSLKMGGHDFESENKLFAHHLKIDGISCEVNVLGNLWTSRVTSHIPVKDVSANLTVDSIQDAMRLIHKTMKLAKVEKPRIGVAALNPHGGEHGTCGTEEIDVIIPAIRQAKLEGLDVYGPYPSDILFVKAFEGIFDAAVTMYHDQGQIALKVKGFQYGVTFHANLPVAIATAAHGSAFDIAGKNLVTTDAMENAIKMAGAVAEGYREQRVTGPEEMLAGVC